jgi:regulator of sigma D
VAEDFPELINIIRQLVKPSRDQNSRRERREKWWHFAEKCPALYHAIGRGPAFARHPPEWSEDSARPSKIIAFAQTSKTKYPHLLNTEFIFDQKVVVIASSELMHFAVLSSSLHYAWVHVHGSRMKTDAVYTPSDVYETFPFPAVNENAALTRLGQELHEFRQSVLNRLSCGLTQLYRLVHSADSGGVDVERIRAIHRDIDQEVASAYGWSDVRLDHGFHTAGYVVDADKLRYTVSEPARFELMRRLSALNRQRHQQEQDAARSLEAAQAELTTPRKRAARPAAKKAATAAAQPQLFE